MRSSKKVLIRKFSAVENPLPSTFTYIHANKIAISLINIDKFTNDKPLDEIIKTKNNSCTNCQHPQKPV